MFYRKRKKSSILESRSSLVLTFMACAVYFFLMLPSVVVVPMSFGDKDEFEFPPSSMSFYLYEKFFTDKSWISATEQSFKVASGTLLLSLILGVSAAYGLVRGKFRGAKALTIFFLSPMLMPAITVALGLYLYFSLLGLSGSTFGLILGHTLVATPFVIITSMSGLRYVDINLENAALILGANRITIFLKVTLPILRPSIIAGGLFSFLISFDEVVIAWFIAGAKTITLPVKMYSSIRWEVSPVLAAVSSLLTMVSIIIFISAALFQKRK